MNTRFLTGVALAFAVVAGSVGSFFLSGKTTQAVAPAPNGVAITTGSLGGGYQSSGKTPQEVIAAEVRQAPDGTLERTMTVHSGILAKNGVLSILNNAHYKDAGNVPVVISTSSLPPGGIDGVKGKTLTFVGSLGDYKGKPQFLAQRVK